MSTLVEMLEAGVHFGHKKERSHPKMKDFIYTLRDGVYVIDLEKTKELLEKAIAFLKRETQSGRTVLFVGTKRQAKDLVKNLAEKLGFPYVNQRWLGGTLTNFETIRKSLNELERLENQVKTSEFEALTKKEKSYIEQKIEKLTNSFGGIRQLRNLPDVVFVVDCNREKIVLEEAFKMNIPVVGLCDTDANPDKITYPIPTNDEATKAIELILGNIETAIREGQGEKVENRKDLPAGEAGKIENSDKTEIAESSEEMEKIEEAEVVAEEKLEETEVSQKKTEAKKDELKNPKKAVSKKPASKKTKKESK